MIGHKNVRISLLKTKQTQATYLIFAISIIAAFLWINYGIQAEESFSDQNSALVALQGILFFGAPLTIAGGFLYSLVAFVYEENRSGKWLIALASLLFILLAWFMGYITMITSLAPINEDSAVPIVNVESTL